MTTRTEKPTKKKPKIIISIDGGGIRGIIPAMVLAELERRTGKPIAEQVDLIAGTSTGGILALGLSCRRHGPTPYSAAALLDMYIKNANTVFPTSWWQKVISLLGLRDRTYSHKGIENILKQYFVNYRLSTARNDVLVTAYDIERHQPLMFKSHLARENAAHDYHIRDVARATSAAPTYFEPAPVTNVPGSYTAHLIDGGVFANNPGLCALAEARRLYGDEEMVVISLGTGEVSQSVDHKRARTWGKIGWLRPILDIMFDGVADSVDYQLRQSLPDNRYFRFQAKLDDGQANMDDVSAKNVQALQYKGEQVIRENAAALEAVVGLLR